MRRLVLVLALAGGGCGGGTEARPPDVVLIVLDTVRPDLLSVYGHPRPTSPFLEELAAGGTRFDRAHTVSCWTLPAHGTLFTGVPPEVHGGNEERRFVADGLPVLAGRLAEAGYLTAGFSANAWVGPRTGLDRGFEHFRDLARGHFRPHVERLFRDADGEHPDPAEHYVVRRVARWLGGQADGERPLFLFVNLVDAHTPYLPHAAAARPFFATDEERRRAMERLFPDADPRPLKVRHYLGDDPLTQAEWDDLRALYEGALRMTDELCRALVEAVEAARSPRDTVVVVLSDHGENLGEHGHVTHLFNLYETNLRIPLIARGPGFRPGRVETAPVQIADVHDTVLHLAGIGGAGVDLRGEVPPDRVFRASLAYPSFSLHQGFPEELVEAGRLDRLARSLEAAIAPDGKWIRASDGWEAAFDLGSDPAEARPLEPGELGSDLRRRLAAVLERTFEPAPHSGAAPGLDAEARRALEAMGYAGEAPAPPRAGSERPRR